jgi:hypothetical protein
MWSERKRELRFPAAVTLKDELRGQAVGEALTHETLERGDIALRSHRKPFASRLGIPEINSAT